MKKSIHPQYYPNSKTTCACGNVVEAGSAREKMDIEVCSACHPFYTGENKLLDSAGQLDRFQKRLEKAEAMKKEIEERKKAKTAKKKEVTSEKKTTTKKTKKVAPNKKTAKK